MNNLYQKLISLCCEKKLVEIYNKNDDFNKFNLGMLISVNQTEYVYVSIDKQGRSDGIRIGLIDDIFRIVDEGKYIDKYSKIISAFGRKISIDRYLRYFSNEKCNLESFLQYSQDEDMVVSLSLCGSNEYNISGLVCSIDENILKLKELDTYGEPVAVSYINIEDIDYCSCDSEDERILKMLYNNK